MTTNNELQANISKKLSKSVLVFLIVYEVVMVIATILGFTCFSTYEHYYMGYVSGYVDIYHDKWFGIEYCYKFDDSVHFYGEWFSLIIFIILFFLVVVPLSCFLISNRKRKLTQLTVSDEEVMGSYTAFIPVAKITLRMPVGKIDNVSAVNSLLFFFTGKAIKIKSTSGAIKIPYVANADEVVDKISEAIKTAKQVAENNGINKDDYTERLKKLADLKEAGVITEEEFNRQKSKLLEKM